jgi:hypothetical protein
MTIEIDHIFRNVTAKQLLPLAWDFSERQLVLNAYFQVSSARILSLADVQSLCGIDQLGLRADIRRTAPSDELGLSVFVTHGPRTTLAWPPDCCSAGRRSCRSLHRSDYRRTKGRDYGTSSR